MGLLWSNRVIPLAMKGMEGQMHGRQFLVRDLDLGGIAPRIPFRLHLQPFAGRGRPDQVDHDFVAHQRSSPPVQADMGKQPMFNLVPLARPRWQMTHRHLQPRRRRKMLQRQLYVCVSA